jgi:hypothetical protein
MSACSCLGSVLEFKSLVGMRCVNERVVLVCERLLDNEGQESEAQVDEMRAMGSESSGTPIRRGQSEVYCDGFGAMGKMDAASLCVPSVFLGLRMSFAVLCACDRPVIPSQAGLLCGGP